jgi:energy-coupling factor transporter transmembrane protein EcfT
MEYSNQDAYNVGKKQKAIIWLVLASIAAFFIPFAPFIVGVIGIIFVAQLAAAQKLPVAWLWAFSQIIPLVSLICLLILNQKATNILKSKGIKVGLMGGSHKEIESLLNNTTEIEQNGCRNAHTSRPTP